MTHYLPQTNSGSQTEFRVDKKLLDEFKVARVFKKYTEADWETARLQRIAKEKSNNIIYR